MILLKNLNDGSNFDNTFLKECYKFTKLIGFTNYQSLERKEDDNLQKKVVWIYQGETTKKI